jgi:membrane protein implicated in regulation of membrane protease activity
MEAAPWWYWIVGGIALMLVELASTTFYVLWFGLAALLVGGLTALVTLSLAEQLTLWALLSIGMAALWFRFFPAPQRTKSGLSKEAVLGERGLIIREISELQKGLIRFQKPILGSDTWPAIADERIASGERARIVDVVGQTLKVERLIPTGGS